MGIVHVRPSAARPLHWQSIFRLLLALSCVSVASGPDDAQTPAPLTAPAPVPVPVPAYPSFHCEAYGHVVECRAADVGKEAVEWAAVYVDRKLGEQVYRSAGGDFSFRLHSRTQIEMHLPFVSGFTPLREWAMWYRGRVVFTEWKPSPTPN